MNNEHRIFHDKDIKISNHFYQKYAFDAESVKCFLMESKMDNNS